MADEGFYGRIVQEAETSKKKPADSHTEARISRNREEALYFQAKDWWTDTFVPELTLAQQELYSKGIRLTLPHGSARDTPSQGCLERSIVFERLAQRSPPYVISVQDGEISFRRKKGSTYSPIDGYNTSVALSKSSPNHVRLMIATIIKDSIK